MNKCYKYIFILLLFGLFFLPLNTHAENLSGTYQFNYALGNNLVQPEYDPNYASTHSPSQTFPNSTTIPIPGVSDPNGGYYTFVKRMYITNYQSFTAGRRYRLTYQLQFDGYVTWTDYYSWGLYPNRSISCDANYGTVYYCSTNFNPQNNVSPYYLTIDVQFSQDVTISQFAIGNISNARDFVLWNRGGSAQGFRIYTATYEDITSPDPSPSPSPSPDQDLTDIENSLDDVNDNLEDINSSIGDVNDNLQDINDTLTDDSSPSTSDIEDIFDDVPILLPGPVSNLIGLPLIVLNTILDEYGSECRSPSLYLPYSNTPIVFPCFKISDYITNQNVMNLITMIGVVFLFYEIAMLIISSWDNWTSLNSTFSSMYQPKHTLEGYSPRHAEGGKK